MYMMINEVLDSLKIRGVCTAIHNNRHYRMFDVKLSPGQRIKKIESQVREIGLALKSHSMPTIDVLADEGVIRIGITTSDAAPIKFEELYEKHKASMPGGLIPVLLGEDSAGDPVWLDINTAPHLIASGATGSGKSVFLHTLIKNLEHKDDVILFLSDPKSGVEFNRYEEWATIAKDYSGTISILKYLTFEMQERYELFETLGIKSIVESPFVVPKLILIVDEMADLMIYDKDKDNPDKGLLESLVVKLAAKSRAIGIHIILSTQRPSVNVLTGLIKANFPTRVCFKVASAVDSRVILDSNGGQDLAGKGQAIINSPTHNFKVFQVAL